MERDTIVNASIILADRATQFTTLVRMQFEPEGEHQREGATKIREQDSREFPNNFPVLER